MGMATAKWIGNGLEADQQRDHRQDDGADEARESHHAA